MSEHGVERSSSGQPHHRGAPTRLLASGFGATWSFVYVFFTNGIPFDAPNRSEPCLPF